MALFSLEHSAAAYRLDLIVYSVTPPALAVWLFALGPAALRLELLAAAAAGLLAWSLIEYLLHRFILHGLAPFSRWHQAHHLRPMALICTPTLWSATLIVALVFLPAFWLWGLWFALALTLGVLSGYAAYTIVHHATHHWRGQSAWMRDCRRSHAQHHTMHKRVAMRGGYYGVTSKFWDSAFRSGLL